MSDEENKPADAPRRRREAVEAPVEAAPVVATPKVSRLKEYVVADGCAIFDMEGVKRKSGERISLTAKMAKALAPHRQLVPIIEDDEGDDE